MKSPSATYLYCLIKSRSAPRLASRQRGLPECGRPRLLRSRDSLWLVVADAPLGSYGEEAIDRGLKDLDWVARCAVAHEEVIESVSGASAVVPMKLFTLFASDERALEHVERRSRELARILARVGGCQEWSFRVNFDPVRAARVVEADQDRADVRPSGAAFLLRKKRIRDDARDLLVRARAEAGRVHGALARAAVSARRDLARPNAPRVPGLLLEAAYLVKSRSAAGFRRQAKKVSEELAKSCCEAYLSGPWPPYNFVGEDS